MSLWVHRREEKDREQKTVSWGGTAQDFKEAILEEMCGKEIYIGKFGFAVKNMPFSWVAMNKPFRVRAL